MREKCDKCDSDILMGNCSCGTWYEPDKKPESLKMIEECILSFNKSGKDIFSGDHHSGSCFVFFKGDYAKVQMVVAFLEKIEAIIRENPEFKKEMKISFRREEPSE